MNEIINKKYPLVSVIIVNLNGKRWLERCIPSVLSSDYPCFEIIVVDNGSTDGSLKYIKDNYSTIKTIRLEKNIGWSPANNKGMKDANGNIIICLSNDMEVDPQWLKEIVKFMESDHTIGIVQCNSLSMWDRKTLDSSMNYLDIYGYSYGYAPKDFPQKVFIAEGMAFATNKRVILDIGMLDDYYFMEYDDMDFSWRAWLSGYKVYYLPTAIVYHARGGTVGTTYFQRIKNVEWYTRNHFVTIIKNYETKTLIKIFPIVLGIELAKIFYLLIIKRNIKIALAAMKGILQVVMDFKIIMRKRYDVQKIRRIPDKEVLKIMHNFKPRLIYSFLASQSKGKRFIMNAEPQLIGKK